MLGRKDVGWGPPGEAGPGHIRYFRIRCLSYPRAAVHQDLNLPTDHMDVLMPPRSLFYREGYRKGYGADGDHLKKPEEVEMALKLGFT